MLRGAGYEHDIPGEGLPLMGKEGGRGLLRIKFKVVFPRYDLWEGGEEWASCQKKAYISSAVDVAVVVAVAVDFLLLLLPTTCARLLSREQRVELLSFMEEQEVEMLEHLIR